MSFAAQVDGSPSESTWGFVLARPIVVGWEEHGNRKQALGWKNVNS